MHFTKIQILAPEISFSGKEFYLTFFFLVHWHIFSTNYEQKKI